MAKALWEQEITKSTNWAGDASTGGDPVSGQYVQKFIKDTLEKKFGHLVYNKEAKKYYVFADEDNYKLWVSNSTLYGKYLLATFDAPAPATIEIRNHEDPSSTVIANQDRTIILGDKGQKIQFNYRIIDNNNRPISEAVVMRVLFSSNTSTETYTQTIAADPRNAENGVTVDFNFDRYVAKEGEYTITVTLTGASTQASASIVFMCNVIDLSFTASFDNLKPVDYNTAWFNIGYTAKGAAGFAKIVNIIVDGEPLYQNELGHPTALSTGDSLGSGAQINDSMSLYIKDANGLDAKWPESGIWANGKELSNINLAGKKIFSPGKHSIQLSAYISLTTGQTVPSHTSYYDFVVQDYESEEEATYILYTTDLAAGQVFNAGANIEVETSQFSVASFTVSVIDTKGRDVQVFYRIYQTKHTSEGDIEVLAYEAKPLVHSGNSNTLNYTFRDSGNMTLRITNALSDDSMTVIVKVGASEAQVAETTSGNIFKYTALNRQNGDINKAVWTNESALNSQYEAAATFNENVLFVDGQTGWTGESLRLKNGAAVTFPINIFAPKDKANQTYDLADLGLAFEVEFTTSNVLNDNARILDYSDETNGSYIKITATSAEIKSQKGASIKTNFKENERIKLAFIINPIRNVTNGQVTEADKRGVDYPNTLMIMVNGVLDRACRWGNGVENATKDTFAWTGNVGNSFTIGDLDGQATVDLTSIRLYKKFLKLDEEFMNYMYDSTGEELLTIYKKNNILDSSNNISFNLVKAMIPTMVMSIDYTNINTGESKKDNYAAEVQYFDPNDVNLNFFARNAWISCQGTSSMKYPTKNLRLYFGKTPNKASKSTIVSSLNSSKEIIGTADAAITKAEYETEFWPYATYGADNEANMHEYCDKILPYSTNKKMDGPDGFEPYKGVTYGIIHEGYHKVGSNLTKAGKFNLIKNYVTIQDPYYAQVYETSVDAQGKEVTSFTGRWDDLKHVPEFYILKEGAKATYLKNAFGNEYEIWASTGFAGYIKGEDGYDMTSYTKAKTDQFEMVHIKVENGSYIIKERNVSVEDYLENNDIYISAYRPLADSVRTFTESGKSDALWQYEKELRYSGAKFYKRIETRENDTLVSVKYEEVKKKVALDRNEFYFSLGSYWRQYNEKGHVSGWTDRWTLKADFAESSMCHNGGVGRLWGNAMKNVAVGTEYPCQTGSQKAVAKSKDSFGGDGIIDIRTSCDGKPIVLFYKQLLGYDETTGKPVYGDSVYAGLFNIMTDKSSTKLFGFEDIYGEDGKKKFGASDVQCWECLQNGSGIPQGASLAFDDGKTPDINDKANLGADRLIFNAYESRFPDTGQERHEFNPGDTREKSGADYEGGDLGDRWPDDVYGVETTALESFLRWLNFCQPAVKYTIGEEGHTIDGYNGNLYNPIDVVSSTDEANIASIISSRSSEDVTDKNTALYYFLRYEEEKAIYNTYSVQSGNEAQHKASEAQKNMQKYNLFIKWNDTGNDAYAGIGEKYVAGQDAQGNNVEETVVFDIEDLSTTKGYTWYSFASDINYESVHKEVNKSESGIIQTDVYLAKMPSFDAKYRFYTNDGEIDEDLASKYKVDVYLTPVSGGRLRYIDETGTEQFTTFDAVELSEEDYLKTSDGKSWKGRTYMDFFSATKGQHLDINKMAAYYIYVIRFGAVDQVVKNTMMTTENAEQWYFINYDNDTILGVRNDGHLAYNWDLDRNTFDSETNNYAFAGAKSSLWNNLEMDDDFMTLVKSIDSQMYQQGLLSAEAVLQWLNEKQMNVWCERLYNAQEEKKYMSTFVEDFTLTNYLAFMHGTRQSHRTWWVTKRWDLYDSKWNTGLYNSQQMHWYFSIDSAQKRQPMYLMTAASDYTFETWANLSAKAGWTVSLKGNETYLFEVPTGEGLVLGDPMRMYGPQKIKIMNLRPITFGTNGSVGLNTNMAVSIKVADSTGAEKIIDWVNVSGSTMTKLLIGSDDTSKTNGITGLDGLNKIYSLEELDVRSCHQLETILMNDLGNLHRFRAIRSGLTEFEPASGAVLYEVSLPDTLQSIILNDVIFKKDPAAEYIVYQGADVKKYDVDSKDVVKDTASNLFGINTNTIIDKLPEYLQPEQYVYCKTYTEIENGAPELVECQHSVTDGYVFEYAPTAVLSSITMKNVSGLDTMQFILDWFDALVNANNVNAIKTINGEQKCVLPITLEGINWIVNDADELINIYKKFTFAKDNTGKELFTGTVYVKNITAEAYDDLIEVFGENVFTPGNALVITAGDAVFFNAKTEPYYTQDINNKEVNIVVAGTKFEIKADVFPVTSDVNYVYMLGLESYNKQQAWYANYGVGGLKEFNSFYNALNSEHNKEVYGFNNGVKLTNNVGSAYLIADPASTQIFDSDAIFFVDVCRYTASGEANKYDSILSPKGIKRMYFKFVKQQMPKSADEIRLTTEGQIKKNSLVFDTKNDAGYEVTVDFANTINVPVRSVAVSFSNQINSTTLLKNSNEAAWITRLDDIKKFNLKYNIVAFNGSPTMPIYITVTFDDVDRTSFTKTFNNEVICIPANEFKVDINGVLKSDEDSIDIDDIIPISLTPVLITEESFGEGTEPNIEYTYTATISNENNISNMHASVEEDGTIKVDITDSFASSTDITDASAYLILRATSDVNFKQIVIRLNVHVVMPDKIVLRRPDLYSGIDILSTSSEFSIDLAKDDEWNGEEKPVITISLDAVSSKGNRPTVPVIKTIESIQINSTETITKDTLLGARTGSKITRGNFFIQMDDCIVNDPVNDETPDSMNAFKLGINKPENTGVSSTDTISVICSLKYDTSVNDTDYQYITKTQETITFEVRRSLHTSSTYKELKHIGQNEDDSYILYAVDDKNRFFEFNCDNAYNVTPQFIDRFTEEVTCASVTGNSSSAWRGVGFVKLEGVNKVPVFLSFEQYEQVPMTVENNQSLIKLGQTPYNAIDSGTAMANRNGAKITELFAGYNEYFNLYDEVYNKYSDGPRLYVPSLKEAIDIWGTGYSTNTDNYVLGIPSAEALALNALIKYMIEWNIITGVNLHTKNTVTATDVTFTDTTLNYDTNLDLVDVLDINKFMNRTSEKIIFETSSINNNSGYNFIYSWVIETAEDPVVGKYYILKSDNNNGFESTAFESNGLMIPFVNVK